MARKRLTRRTFLKTAAAGALVAGSPIRADAQARGVAFPDVAPGTWGEIPGTALRPTIPKTLLGPPPDTTPHPALDASYFGGNASVDQGIMTDWCGGAWAEDIETLFVHGGGHSSGPVANLFAFALDTLTWRVESPQLSAYQIGDPRMGDNGLPTNPDGTPASVHSYGCQGYAPVTGEFLRHGLTRWSKSGAGDGAHWAWSVKNRAWRRTAEAPESNGPTGYPGWHPTYRVLLAVFSALWGWDPVADQWLQITARGRGKFPNRAWSVFDSKRNRVLAFSQSTWPDKVSVIDIGRPWPKSQSFGQGNTLQAMTGAIPPEWTSVGYHSRINGFYDEQRDVLVHWGGAGDIYAMDATFNWKKATGTGSVPGDGLFSQTTGRQIWGIYNRFFRLKGRDLYGLVTDVDSNVKLYRPLDGAPPPQRKEK